MTLGRSDASGRDDPIVEFKSEKASSNPDNTASPLEATDSFVHPSVDVGLPNLVEAFNNSFGSVALSIINSDALRQAPSQPRTKYGGTANGRAPLNINPSVKGPPGVPPPSSLYTAVISPKEMAQHEATNFKNVKGVYKNCRGIWAAQWTDERGQRHTKYFNPKYYSTEAEARHEAFKFKVHISREIELRGGVQKRRLPPATTAKNRGNDTLLEHPYMRERQRRPNRHITSKSRIGRDTESCALDLYASGFFPSNIDVQQSIAYTDFFFQQQQQQQQQQQHHYLQGGQYPQSQELQQGTASEDLERSPLTNSSCSPGSPPATMYFAPQTFDPIYLPSAANQQAFNIGSPLMPRGLSLSANSAFDVERPSGTIEDGMSGKSNETHTNGNSTLTTLQPGTMPCICGCGGVAILPARYSAHHHARGIDFGQRSQDSIDGRELLFPLMPDSKQSQLKLCETSTSGATDVPALSFLGHTVRRHNSFVTSSPEKKRTSPCISSASLESSTIQGLKRYCQDQRAENLADVHQNSTELPQNYEHQQGEHQDPPCSPNSTPQMKNSNCEDRQRKLSIAANGSFPFPESWSKSFPGYSSFPERPKGQVLTSVTSSNSTDGPPEVEADFHIKSNITNVN